MFIPSHCKPITSLRFYTLSTYHPKVDQIIQNLGDGKQKSWVDQINEDAGARGVGLNTSKVRPIHFSHHPVKLLNRVLREKTALQDKRAIEYILSDIKSKPFKHHVLANVLHIPAKEGNNEIAKLLLENGADVDARYGNIKSEWTYQDQVEEAYAEGRGPSALFFAVMRQKVETVQILINHHADVNLSADMIPGDKFYTNVRPLHYAAAIGNCEIISDLLKAHADPNAQNGAGENPLLTAVWKGHLKAVDMLLKAGADPKQKNDWGIPMTGFTTNEEIIRLLNKE